MLELEIYEKENASKQPVRLAFEKRYGKVVVIAVDANGEKVEAGNLLAFTADGRIELFNGVSPRLGFTTDVSGRIVTTQV